jgi:polygalacturonase
MINRRDLIQFLAASSTTLHSMRSIAKALNPWEMAQNIIKAFDHPLQFKKKDYWVSDFGAQTCKTEPQWVWIAFETKISQDSPIQNAFDSNSAINKAIQECHNNGGGRVILSSGTWLSNGPIVLLSNVNLHLQKNTVLYFGNNPRDYAKNGAFDCGPNGKLTLSRWEGNDLLNYSPLIYAFGQTNIALTGEDWSSVIDGQGGVTFENDSDCWWSWKGRSRSAFSDTNDHVTNQGKSEAHVNPNNPERLSALLPKLSTEQERYLQGEGERFRRDPEFLRALAEAGIPATSRIFGIGHYLRPHTIQLINCSNVLLKGYQVRNSPFWQQNPVHCKNLHIDSVFANGTGPNNDGLNPESCENVLIENCQFNTGDDCIAIESGKGPDTQYGPSKNIVIRKCNMQSGHGGITFGSVMSGGIENVFVQDVLMENKHWKTDPLNIAIRFKANMSRGGFIRNIYIKDINLPNGIRTTPSMYRGLPNGPIPDQSVATNSGAIITIDCGYDPFADNVRSRPPVISDIHISRVRAGNVMINEKLVSSYQALVILGPIASDFNANDGSRPKILPVSDVTIENCDLGNPINISQPIYMFNAQNIRLQNVVIGNTRHDDIVNNPT